MAVTGENRAPPQAFAALIASDMKECAHLVKRAGVKVA